MSYLPNPGEMNHLPSSVLGGGMMGRGGGGVDLTASMMGGGVDLSTLGGGLGGLSGEDMMHSQPNADSTDISMLSGYMSSAHHGKLEMVFFELGILDDYLFLQCVANLYSSASSLLDSFM